MTKEQAIKRAKHFGLETEVKESLALGMTPEEALFEWDLFLSHSFNYSLLEYL